MKTRPEEREESRRLCELAFNSEAEFPHGELMRLLVPPIFMDDDVGGVMRFAAWHTPHYVSRLLEDVARASTLEKRVNELEAKIAKVRP